MPTPSARRSPPFCPARDGGGHTPLLLLAIVAGAPFAEELFFRGVLFARLEAFQPALVIFVAAVLFGLAHFDLARLPLLVALGLLLGIARHRSGGLLAPVLAHALHNAASVAIATLG